MRTYASPRRGRCASCEDRITGRPVYRMDEAYCCAGCAVGGPCTCSYDVEMADDGVDRLSMPFAIGEHIGADNEADRTEAEPSLR